LERYSLGYCKIERGRKMGATVVLGMQWGDEAKGKIVDMLAAEHDFIVRFNGGSNAGHTIKSGKEVFKLHLIPSGVFHPEKMKVIGNGVVVSPKTLLKEIKEVESRGYPLDNLIVSDSAHVVMPWHIVLDGIEDKKGGIGTTKRGIGPCYSDRAARVTAIRGADFLLSENNLKEKIHRIGNLKNSVIVALGGEKLDIEAIAQETVEQAAILRKYVRDTRFVLNRAVSENKKVLLEGAQGALLDIDHGTYPFVSSSSITVGGACTGTGVPPKRLGQVIGVTKAYTTRVGSGPFPTELENETGEKIREAGAEFGTTTGRPRRCGWLDLVILKYTSMINGPDSLAIMKLDVLDGLEELKVCTHYEINQSDRNSVTTSKIESDQIGNVKETDEFPANLSRLQDAKPIYKTLKGWGKFDWSAAKKREDLPKELQDYLKFIEDKIGVPVSIVSFGPAREETLTI
jgi:adenylosuccinate synthase